MSPEVHAAGPAGGGDRPRRVLFVPVSGASGIGEYMRCRIVADGLRARHPAIETPFVISQEAPYATEVPAPVFELPDTPTRESGEVIGLIRRLRPDVVVFDNAGRTEQLRSASEAGARVVFVSSRPKKRRKGFRWRWLDTIDAHWIAYPSFLSGELTRWERFKVVRHPSVRVTFLGAVFPDPEPARATRLCGELGVRDQAYVLVVPGGGGTHRGATDAIATFVDAAGRIATDGGLPVVLVLGPAYRGDLPRSPGVRALRAVSGEDMANLVAGCRVAVLNGGSTLTQALAVQRPCVAAPIAGDQRERIRRCAELGLVDAVERRAEALAGAAVGLVRDDDRRRALVDRVRATGLRNGLHLAVADLERLVGVAAEARPRPAGGGSS